VLHLSLLSSSAHDGEDVGSSREHFFVTQRRRGCTATIHRTVHLVLYPFQPFRVVHRDRDETRVIQGLSSATEPVDAFDFFELRERVERPVPRLPGDVEDGSPFVLGDPAEFPAEWVSDVDAPAPWPSVEPRDFPRYCSTISICRLARETMKSSWRMVQPCSSSSVMSGMQRRTMRQ
jgi:hypothetical protein